ncbi:MAG: hypothetical protein Q9M36_09175, partial [Sulfurovum sp.]|nr:hypothetical protein [Sulfurovum sp.]
EQDIPCPKDWTQGCVAVTNTAMKSLWYAVSEISTYYNTVNIMAYTQKQIDKFMRQKYISELDKVAKNIFRMLRNENMIAKKVYR